MCVGIDVLVKDGGKVFVDGTTGGWVLSGRLSGLVGCVGIIGSKIDVGTTLSSWRYL